MYNYVEPFLGGGALALAITKAWLTHGATPADMSTRMLVNDGNPHLTNLWQRVIDFPKELKGLIPKNRRGCKYFQYEDHRNLFSAFENFVKPKRKVGNFCDKKSSSSKKKCKPNTSKRLGCRQG